MSRERRLAFRLALALGYANPDAMLAEMPDRIWREWLIYLRYDPFGNERGDIRLAALMTQIANLFGRKEGQPQYRVEDFLFDFEAIAERPVETPEDRVRRIVSKLTMFTALSGGEIRHGAESKNS